MTAARTETARPASGSDPASAEPSPEPVIVSARSLIKTYGSPPTAVHALGGIDVDIVGGTFTAIMGPSGSGKSTLMHCLAGLDSITSGQVMVAGIELGRLSDRALTRLRRDRIGFVFQAFNLLPALSTRDNVVLPLELAGRRVDPERLAMIIESLGLTERLDHRPGMLSGGQQQRVAIARALITEPDVIFADEPTGALDSDNSEALLSELRRASRELGQTIVMVTHDPIAASFADRVLILNDGRLTDDLDRPDPEHVQQLITRPRSAKGLRR